MADLSAAFTSDWIGAPTLVTLEEVALVHLKYPDVRLPLGLAREKARRRQGATQVLERELSLDARYSGNLELHLAFGGSLGTLGDLPEASE